MVRTTKDPSLSTNHQILISDARKMRMITDSTVDLVVTSPPYPMIQMWDEIFSQLNPKIGEKLQNGNGNEAFRLMHEELGLVWRECYRVLKAGGIMCVNIGDATRTIQENFQLYPSHSSIIMHCLDIGFQSLPEILWRKQTNAPNKFMGSGMLPPGAYVTLEHEFILIFRKGTKKEFKATTDKMNRSSSAYFWEERNQWFSDVWDFKGTTQSLGTESGRERSAAFPFELPFRLINMFSTQGDTVLDPFLGTGTTMLAAMASGRNSIGIEIDESFKARILERIRNFSATAVQIQENRINAHKQFIEDYSAKKGIPKYINEYYKFSVITNQEVNLVLPKVETVTIENEGNIRCKYSI
jgi:DNA modification methylase